MITVLPGWSAAVDALNGAIELRSGVIARPHGPDVCVWLIHGVGIMKMTSTLPGETRTSHNSYAVIVIAESDYVGG